ncbi:MULTISPECIES: galactokinase [Clostridium]|uniref:Galactokinase n=2 Tax=Clostridium TaxID=1485 RepID=A0A1I2JMC7_9CLOT|nr:galactokinase [Clostridium cadaveris]MDU4953600.1 galactokinase [Clostridium sp.]MDM8312697.1 galactokinase [Clostridium cadaveris]NME66163.1 galactokinase [Clostridium cadaveris]NWK11119.1 galactokinase [Clostridium cadaveris]UFH66028.1 galactokinase [Clostridium cadaveris]
MDIVTNLLNSFKEIFKSNAFSSYFSPGRVNLIGEHTDYNGGHVFPCALSIGTYGLIERRNDKKFKVYSMNFEENGIIEFDLDNLVYSKEHGWANYPKGIIKILKDHGFNIPTGLNILVYGNIPNGSGLSSSASLLVLIGVILKDVFGFSIDMVEIAKLCQEAENKFIGVNCGIMDEFAICMGKENSAILLDCNTLKYRYSTISMSGYKLVIGNTNKKRTLVDSKYNERRSECEEALHILQKYKNISSLGELSEEEFNSLKHHIDNPILLKRARHAVSENQRTLKAVNALEENNMKLFGRLLNDSHESLKNDYEVTGIELDTLVSSAQEQNDIVLGSRMTGAGFGGCTVSLVKEDSIDKFIEHSTKQYEEKIGYAPSFYIVDISDGAKKLMDL